MWEKKMEFSDVPLGEDEAKGGFYNFDDIEANDNFMLTETGLTFTYNPYAIAPYDADDLVVEIPYAEIAHLLNLEAFAKLFPDMDLQEQANKNKEKTATLYAHFSRQTILQNMADATKKMNTQPTTSDDDGYKFALLMAYGEIVDKDINHILGRESDDWNYDLNDFIRKFGQPLKMTLTNSDTLDNRTSDWHTVDFPLFTIETWADYYPINKKAEHEFIGIATSTPGYGFGGIYVGIPECNKEYIGKLFALVPQNNINKDTEKNSWGIILYGGEGSYNDIGITFDENDLVKSVSYYTPPIR